MERVMIVGGSGAGKSTLARKLGACTGLPVHHMDHIHWQAGWQMRPRAERRALVRAIEDSPRWVFEGGFSESFDHRAMRADTLIWLDLPLGLRLWRVTRRLFTYWGRQRPDMAPGCPEGLHAETLKFYKWIWDTRQSHRDRLQCLTSAHPHLSVFRLTAPRQVRAFLRDAPWQS